MNRTYTIIFLIVLIVSALVIYPYYSNFGDRPLSAVPSEWGSFGDYIGGLLNPIFGFFSLVGLLLTLYQTNKTNTQQWQYIDKTEKKKEWLIVIEHTENQLRSILLRQVKRSDGLIFDIGSALSQTGKIMQKESKLRDLDYAQKVLTENWEHLETSSFNSISNLLASLAMYIENYSHYLMEENKSEIVSHYISSYLAYVSALQWMGVMSERDSKRWNQLQFMETKP